MVLFSVLMRKGVKEVFKVAVESFHLSDNQSVKANPTTSTN